MNRTTLNQTIDAIGLMLFIALATTGLLMEFSLPPQSGGAAVWGMTRHDWGDVHFWIAVGFLTSIGVHLILHNKWIVAAVRGKPSAASRVRPVAAIGVLAALLATAAVLLLSPVDRSQAEEGRHGEGRGRNANHNYQNVLYGEEE